MANPIKYFSTNDLLYLLTLLKSEYEKYVEAVSGYGLISDADLTKLSGIASGAQVNVLEGILINGTEQTIDANKKITLGTAANKDVPSTAGGTATSNEVVRGDDPRLSDARNSADVTDTYSASSHAPMSGVAVAQALATITGISFESYPSFADLPAVGQTGVIYLVPNSGTGSNVKDEYFWNATTQAYELFGTTQVDLTNYLQDTDVIELTQAEVLAAWNSVFGS